MQSFGISAIGIQLPSRAIDVRQLAALRGVDPDKFTKGLGCHEIALCGEGEDAVSLGVGAAKRALEAWGEGPEALGMIAVGTETAQDMSRPLSAFVAEKLELRGALRSYEVKHACYGGTLALRQALEWVASGANQGKSALVIATDVSLYAPGDPGEPTQGAGAVAMIVGAPTVAEVSIRSHAWSEPVFDFWRPVGEAHPRVDGPLSLDCYKRGAWETAKARFGAGLGGVEELHAFCFHTPFPKMVLKAVRHLGAEAGWDDKETASFYETKVQPSMRFNRLVGNSYTASLWLAVADILRDAPAGAEIAAYSYGSGFGAELLTLRAQGAPATWVQGFEADVANRELIDQKAYDTWRG